jgi:hypothetical protein
VARPAGCHGPEVEGRAADESGREACRRPAVEVEGRRHLLDAPRAQQGHATAEGHGLSLIVRDVERGRAQLLLESLELAPGLHAELGVEVRERLVHQADRGRAHDRARERDPLLLPAGELGRPAVEQGLELETRRRLPHAGIDLRGGRWRARSGNAMFSKTVRCG